MSSPLFSAPSANRENLKSALSDGFVKPLLWNQSFFSCRSSHTVLLPVTLPIPVALPYTGTAVSARDRSVSRESSAVLEC